MPTLGWDSVTLSTAPIPSGGELCAHLPEAALRALGAEDVLITIFFSAVAGPNWPETGFDDAVFPISASNDAHECSDRPELEVHWGSWSIGDTGVYLLAAFGDEIGAERRTEAWTVLSSLRPGSGDNFCVATRPADPDWIPPAPYNATPSDPATVWYGSPDLWTPLRRDGTYPPRKSVWWSQHIAAGDTEVAVQFERIDINPHEVVRQTGSGVSFTPEDGSFVIAGLEPDTPGCWRVTASHSGTQLSYVYWVPQV